MKKIGLFIAVALLGSGLLPRSSIAVGEPFTMDVQIITSEENVNAFGGKLIYPKEWSVEEIILKSPNLLYWIEAPKELNPGEIAFSGIFPGGIENINSSNAETALFAIDFLGDVNIAAQAKFEEAHFYLNHPTALEAGQALFSYGLSSESPFETLTSPNLFNDVNYAFEKDPVSLEDVLVVDSYRGSLAAYTFNKKEGMWFGEWESIDGVQALNSNISTVLLNIESDEGEEATLTLRKSLLYSIFWPLALSLSGLALFYLGFLFVRKSSSNDPTIVAFHHKNKKR